MFMHTYLTFNIFVYIWTVWDFSECFFLSPLLSLVYISALMEPKCKSTPSRNPFRSGASSSFDPTPSSTQFCDEDARKDFLENFSRWGIHSECRVILADFADIDLLDVIHSWGWESLCDVLVTCPSVLIQEFYSNMHGLDSSVPLFYTRVRSMRIIVTPELVSDMLRVLKVEHPDYPGCECLRTMSEDEMISVFSECPSDWGDHQFIPCSTFAKGPRFMNMVMTSVLHPLFHYNSITEPLARFFLSLLEHLIIDFSSHFILFIIDVYRDTTTCDKLIFPSAITLILCHFSVPFPSFIHFPVMCAIDYATVKRSEA